MFVVFNWLNVTCWEICDWATISQCQFLCYSKCKIKFITQKSRLKINGIFTYTHGSSTVSREITTNILDTRLQEAYPSDRYEVQLFVRFPFRKFSDFL
ncbi:hypothetical protein RCL_jg13598.t1 [Rhizophagus clarus]|uniref:Uncharacterized protein n=1 Tax=Rhizophagus clarus TaxID=94130 RepID=A0A8H3LQV7_9GLOM|nr:hypothetical protein RCL_jg13598.t1 [Rhizophagus clarus]